MYPLVFYNYYSTRKMFPCDNGIIFLYFFKKWESSFYLKNKTVYWKYLLFRTCEKWETAMTAYFLLLLPLQIRLMVHLIFVLILYGLSSYRMVLTTLLCYSLYFLFYFILIQKARSPKEMVIDLKIGLSIPISPPVHDPSLKLPISYDRTRTKWVSPHLRPPHS